MAWLAWPLATALVPRRATGLATALAPSRSAVSLSAVLAVSLALGAVGCTPEPPLRPRVLGGPVASASTSAEPQWLPSR